MKYVSDKIFSYRDYIYLHTLDDTFLSSDSYNVCQSIERENIGILAEEYGLNSEDFDYNLFCMKVKPKLYMTEGKYTDLCIDYRTVLSNAQNDLNSYFGSFEQLMVNHPEIWKGLNFSDLQQYLIFPLNNFMKDKGGNSELNFLTKKYVQQIYNASVFNGYYRGIIIFLASVYPDFLNKAIVPISSENNYDLADCKDIGSIYLDFHSEIIKDSISYQISDDTYYVVFSNNDNTSSLWTFSFEKKDDICFLNKRLIVDKCNSDEVNIAFAYDFIESESLIKNEKLPFKVLPEFYLKVLKKDFDEIIKGNEIDFDKLDQSKVMNYLLARKSHLRCQAGKIR